MYQLWDNNFRGFLYFFFSLLSLAFFWDTRTSRICIYIIKADDPSSGTQFHLRED